MEVCPENMTDQPTNQPTDWKSGIGSYTSNMKSKKKRADMKKSRIYGLREKTGIRDKISPIFCNTIKKVY